MGMPTHPVSLTPAQIEELNTKLSKCRHDINGCLAVIIAAAELIRREPSNTLKRIETVAEQPQRIMEELQKFSHLFEQQMGITRD